MSDDLDHERAKEWAAQHWHEYQWPASQGYLAGLATGRAESAPRLCCADCGAAVPGPPYPSGHWHDCPAPGRYLSQTAGPLPQPQEPPR